MSADEFQTLMKRYPDLRQRFSYRLAQLNNIPGCGGACQETRLREEFTKIARERLMRDKQGPRM